MRQGNLYLQVWLRDQIRQGLASLQAQPEQYWDDFAALMVDHKLGAIARRIQKIKSLLSAQHNIGALMHEFADLHLFCQGFERLDQVPDTVRDELLKLGGMSHRKEEILARTGQIDYWLVVGVRQYAEEKLNVRRTWLLGEECGKFALILDFSWGNQGFVIDYVAGSAFKGEIVFYPGITPLRALVKHSELEARAFSTPPGVEGINNMSRDFSKQLAQNPWLRSYPYLLTDVVPFKHEEDLDFRLIDRNRNFISFSGAHEQASWKLFALGGLEPVDVFGEWDGYQLSVLSAFRDGRLIVL